MKYKFTGQTKIYKGRTLRQIYNDDTGRVGGWIEHPHNLSQFGKCWVHDGYVYGDAIVTRDAMINGGSIICGKAVVTDQARVHNSVVRGRSWVGGITYLSDNYVWGSTTLDGGRSFHGDLMDVTELSLTSLVTYIKDVLWYNRF